MTTCWYNMEPLQCGNEPHGRRVAAHVKELNLFPFFALDMKGSSWHVATCKGDVGYLFFLFFFLLSSLPPPLPPLSPLFSLFIHMATLLVSIAAVAPCFRMFQDAGAGSSWLHPGTWPWLESCPFGSLEGAGGSPAGFSPRWPNERGPIREAR